METSLRLRSGGGLRIHAKEKLPLGHSSLLQAHAEVDLHTSQSPAGVTAPSYLALFVRHFYRQLSANLGAGVQLHNGDGLSYSLRAKKTVLFKPDNGYLGLNLKGRLLTDKEFKPTKTTGAVELAWTILDFKQGQDVRLKFGYELYDKITFDLVINNLPEPCTKRGYHMFTGETIGGKHVYSPDPECKCLISSLEKTVGR